MRRRCAPGNVGNAIAQRAVKLVAESVGGAVVDASDAALGRLVTGRVIETVAAQLLLHGNAFVQVLRDADGSAAELCYIRCGRNA